MLEEHACVGGLQVVKSEACWIIWVNNLRPPCEHSFAPTVKGSAASLQRLESSTRCAMKLQIMLPGQFYHTSYGVSATVGAGGPGSTGSDGGVHACKVKGDEHQLSQPQGQGALSLPNAVTLFPPGCVLRHLRLFSA